MENLIKLSISNNKNCIRPRRKLAEQPEEEKVNETVISRKHRRKRQKKTKINGVG